MTDFSSSTHATGLMSGLAGVAKNGFGLLLSRLELAALELSQVRNQVLKIALVFALSILAIWFALAYGTVLIVYLTWDMFGWKTLLVMTLAFIAIALGLLWYLMSMIKHGKLSLPVTMAEIKADRDMLL